MINIFFESEKVGEIFSELMKMINRFSDEKDPPVWVTYKLWVEFSKASASLFEIRKILEAIKYDEQN